MKPSSGSIRGTASSSGTALGSGRSDRRQAPSPPGQGRNLGAFSTARRNCFEGPCPIAGRGVVAPEVHVPIAQRVELEKPLAQRERLVPALLVHEEVRLPVEAVRGVPSSSSTHLIPARPRGNRRSTSSREQARHGRRRGRDPGRGPCGQLPWPSRRPPEPAAVRCIRGRLQTSAIPHGARAYRGSASRDYLGNTPAPFRGRHRCGAPVLPALRPNFVASRLSVSLRASRVRSSPERER